VYLRLEMYRERPLVAFQWSKIYPNLPKTAQISLKTISSWNFEIPPKIEILVFFKKKTSMCRRDIKALRLRFWLLWQEFSICLFQCQKMAIICEFQYTFLWKKDVFLIVPYIQWIWNFVYMYLTNLGTRIWSPSIHTYFKNAF
jgi:hypothetical protein